MAPVRCLLAVCCLLGLQQPVWAAELPPIFGDWHTENQDSTVRLYPCGEELCGVIVALKVPPDVDPESVLDTHNKKAELRTRPLLGLEFLRGFEKESDGRWTDGYAYNPRDGFGADGVDIERQGPDALEISGCILWGAVCQSEVWTRAPDTGVTN